MDHSGEVKAYLQDAKSRYPNLWELFHEFETLYNRHLWHQLTVKIEESLHDPAFHNPSVLIPFYHKFIANFAHKINLLKLARIAKDIALLHQEPDAAVSFLKGVIATIEESNQIPAMEQPLLYLQMFIAQYQLQMGYEQACKDALEVGKAALDNMTDVDPDVSAQVYLVRAMYYKHKQDFAEFYRSSLLYLAFITSDQLPHETKLALAVDISLAALLGDNIYNFGELLLHPIVCPFHGKSSTVFCEINVLKDSPYKWLHDMLECFNQGALDDYDKLCQHYAAVLNAQPAMVENERKLREKITILCLLESIFNTTPDHRTYSLGVIAQHTKLSLDGVEFLLMKALSLHLIEGVIDQVAGIVQVTWVQPRVLTFRQIGAVSRHIGFWLKSVESATDTLEQESSDVL